MNPQSAIQKGKELEKYVRDLLISNSLDSRAERTPGSGNGNRKKGDVDNNLGICFECKNTKTMSWKATAEQVRREAMGQQTEIVVWHPPQRPMSDSVVIINVLDYIELLKAAKNHTPKVEILDRWAIKSNLERAVYHLKKVINDV